MKARTLIVCSIFVFVSKMCRELTETLIADEDDNLVYVYVIHVKIKEVFDSKISKTKKKIWDRKNCRLGLITNNELPHVSATYQLS